MTGSATARITPRRTTPGVTVLARPSQTRKSVSASHGWGKTAAKHRSGSLPLAQHGGDVARAVEKLRGRRLHVGRDGAREDGKRGEEGDERHGGGDLERPGGRRFGGRVRADGRVAVDFQKRRLPARAKPTIVKSEPTRIAVQAHADFARGAERVEHEKLAEEARQRRHPRHGDGGGEEERGEEAVLDGGGLRDQAVVAAAA